MKLPVLHATLRLVRDNYVEPARVVPSELFRGALRGLERQLAPVIVSTDDAAGLVVVRADEHAMSIPLSRVKGLWDVLAVLGEVFAFLRSSLHDQGANALSELEIAACKGLLESLDQDAAWVEGDGSRAAGLGVAVSSRGGALVVERVVPKLPAARAGLEPHDVIARIDDQLTQELTVEEALGRLRGPLSSPVVLLVRRSGKGGWQGEKRFTLRREGFAISPLESRQLRPGIGYVRIKRLAPATADELTEVLEAFREHGSLAGLVLDLRDNHGGMFAEAAKIADVFLEDGSIALTRGPSEGSEEKKALKYGTEPRCPLVILTNSVTASGSELIASALQKNERAVIVGETTVGSAKVQLLFPNVAANTAISLPIAEFQAPAGTPLHGVGVIPDVELRAARVDGLQPRFLGPFERVRARDRLHVFSEVVSQRRPETTIWYASRANSVESIDVGEQSPRDDESDFALRFATDLVAQLREGSRSKQLESARPFLQSVGQRELATLGGQLQASRIDWRPRPSDATDGPQSTDFAVKVTTDRAHDTAAAGGSMRLIVAVTNRSRLPAYQLQALTKSQNADYHEKELLFGYVGSGQTVTRRVSFGRCDEASSRPATECRLSMPPAKREDVVRIVFQAPGGEAPRRAELRPVTTARSQTPRAPSSPNPVSIEVEPLPLSHRQERIAIKGIATGHDGVRDVRVFVNERKVLYRRVGPAPAPLPFEADVPLNPGINVLRVLARDRNDATSTRTFIIRRDGAQAESLRPREHDPALERAGIRGERQQLESSSGDTVAVAGRSVDAVVQREDIARRRE